VTDRDGNGDPHRQKHLTTGLVPVSGGGVLNYAMIRPDGQPEVTTPLTDKQAVDLADLRSMANDLQWVLQYCDELDRLDERKASVLRRAPAQAAVITYGRCHTTGRSSAHRRARRVLPKAVIDGLPPHLQEAHKQYKDLRDEEVGHRAGAGEHCRVLAIHDQPGGPVTQVGTVMLHFPIGKVDGLRELATEVLQRVWALDTEEAAALMTRLSERGVS
jgi:hypothetical protein